MRQILAALLLTLGLASPALAAVCSPTPALPDTERRTEYTGIVAQTGPFNVNFQLYGDGTDYGNWVSVWVNGVALTPVTDFTVTSPSGPLANLCRPITDAQVTFTAAQTGTIEIEGSRRPRRTSQFSENAGVPARSINQVLSDMEAQLRERWDRQPRLVRTAPGDSLTGVLPPAATRAGKFLMFDATGLIPQVATGAGSGNVVGPVSSVVNDIAVWNNTTGTLLADASFSTVFANSFCATSGAFPVYNATSASWACSTIGGAGAMGVFNGNPNQQPANGGVFTINASGVALPPTGLTSGTLALMEAATLWLSGPPGSPENGDTIIIMDSFGINANALIQPSRGGGTAGAPSATLDQFVMFDLCPTGWSGSPLRRTGISTCMQFLADGGDWRSANFTGTGSGTNLTVSAVSGTIGIGDIITGTGVPAGTTIVSQTSGPAGGAGVYVTSVATTSSGAALYTGSQPMTINFYTTPVGSLAGPLRFSIAQNGQVIERFDGIGAGQFDGISLVNKTVAAAGAQQNSPSLALLGQGWKTNATAGSQPVEWILTNVPIQGAANPSSALTFGFQVNSGGFSTQATLTSGGVFNTATGFQIGGAAASGNFLRGNGTNYVGSTAAFSDLTGSLACGQHPALTGDVTTPAGSCATTLASITSGALMPGFIDATGIAAPAAPAAGKGRIFVANNATNNLKVETSSGGFSMTAVPISVVSNQFLTGMDVSGTFSQAQVPFSGLSGIPTTLAGYGITSPLPFAQGGTADTGTAATSFSGTLAPTCGTATFTTNSARWKQVLAKLTWFQIDVTITAIGTCSGNNFSFTLPNTAQSSAAWGGEEVATTGYGFQCRIQASGTGVSCARFDSTKTWALNDRLSIAGTYENQ